jgi:hypothetical protein
MERLEALLEKLTSNSPHAPEIDNSPRGTDGISLTSPMRNPRLTPISPVDNLADQHALADNPMSTLNTPSIVSPMLSNHTSEAHLGRKIEGLRQQLAVLLPSQGDANQLQKLSYGWWLIQRHMLPYSAMARESGFHDTFDIAFVSRSHPVVIGKLLLSIAICIQQLPPYAARNLETKVPLKDLMERNVNITCNLITSDDDLTGSLDGIECLTLQALYHANAGNLRRALLAFRRAIDVAHLMGLHRASLDPCSDKPSFTSIRRYSLWQQLSRGVRKETNFAGNYTDIQ